MNEDVKFVQDTLAQFQAIAEKDPNTLYWITDKQQLYKGDKLFGTGLTATEAADGLLSKEDKQKLEYLAKGTVHEFTEGDASVVIEDAQDHDGGSNGKKIKVGISTKEDNTLVLEADGLYVGQATYAIEKTDGNDQYAAVYKLKMTKGEETSYVGDEINIPKDLVLQSGKLAIVDVAETPYAGAQVGDPYIDLELNAPESPHIYIPMKGIIDTSNFVIRSVKTNDDEALISNDPTGGGLWYKKADGVESFIGVNNGAEDNSRPTPRAQIYAAAMQDGKRKDGAFLNIYQDRIIYNSRERMKAGAKNGDEDGELVIKADIDNFVEKSVTGDRGTSAIFNEKDGGGAKFERTDNGLKSFVGVHDGSTVGETSDMAVQIYAVDGSGLGSRLNVFQDRMTYISKDERENATSLDDPNYEIVVKKDLDTLSKEIKQNLLVWRAIGELTQEEMDAVVTKIATDTLGSYANITLTGDQVAAQIKSSAAETDLNVTFGITLLTALKNSGLKSVEVQGHEDSKIDLTNVASFSNVQNFVTAAGFTANKLKELNGNSLTLVFTDIGDVKHTYTLSFTLEN